MAVLGVLAWLLAVPLSLAAAVLGLELLLGVRARGAVPPRSGAALDAEEDGPRPPLAVLIPAHDEAAGIGATLDSVRAQLCPGDRVLVVADNCSDATAAVVRRAGFEAVERRDAERRGKGYALDFGLAALEREGGLPAVVVVLDADCLLGAGALDRLARASARLGRTAQARYTMQRPPGAEAAPSAPPAASASIGIAEFAWAVKNVVRPLGLWRLGLPCPLFGSGMAFDRDSLRTVSLANGKLAEDMHLGVELALRGRAPAFVPGAEVSSRFASSREGQDSQRRRWEHGHLETLLFGVPRLLGRALRRADRAALALGLDLLVPPLSLLVMLLAVGLAASGLLAVAGGAWGPFVLLAATGALLALGLVRAWDAFGRASLPPSALRALPGFVLRKLGLYVAFVFRRQRSWVRTQREAEPPRKGD